MARCARRRRHSHWPLRALAYHRDCVGSPVCLAYAQYSDGRWPEDLAFYSYDAFLLAIDAIKRSRTLNGADLVAALENSDIELAAGHYAFPYRAQHTPVVAGVPDYMWHQWPDAQILLLEYIQAGQQASDAPVIWPPAYRTVATPYVQ